MNLKSIRWIFLAVSFIFPLDSCQHSVPEREGDIYWLTDGQVQLAVLPGVGGRIVFFGPDRQNNFLKSDPQLWNEADSLRPKISSSAGWKAYNGHTVWIGPQSGWWKHQDIDLDKRNSAAVWPPDPWLIYSPYEVREAGTSHIVMEGPGSPVSGLRLTKRIIINGDSSVDIIVEAENVRDTTISWDIWMNTRVDGNDRVYVPVKDSEQVRFSDQRKNRQDTIAYTVEDGYFTFLPVQLKENQGPVNSKAFITPSGNWMAMMKASCIFKIEFHLYDPAFTHPEQGMVEIYNYISGKAGEALTEMEIHGPFSEIKPGEKITLTEKWRLIPLDRNTSPELLFREF